MSVHPFLYPFGEADRWMTYIEKCLRWNPQDVDAARSLLERNLIPLSSGVELADYLGISRKLVGHMVVASHKYYRTFKIKKKSGGERTITAPRVFLKVVQHYILDCILTPILPCANVVGFVRGRSITHGAQRHIGKPFLWNIDIKDFFPSIGQTRVRAAFEQLGYSPKASYFLSGLCCLNGILPQGAPTSPALANLVFAGVDAECIQISGTVGITYTRYADDLSFSSNIPIARDFQKTVENILITKGFLLNVAKSRLMGPRCRREVTGLTVNRQVSIPRVRRRQIRAIFHQVSLSPENFSERKQELQGLAAWVSQYHPTEGSNYLALVKAIADLPKH